MSFLSCLVYLELMQYSANHCLGERAVYLDVPEVANVLHCFNTTVSI